MKGTQREAAFRAVNPQMLLPALVDDDGPPLFQSLAIMEYLDETHPQPPLLPSTPRARARVRALRRSSPVTPIRSCAARAGIPRA